MEFSTLCKQARPARPSKRQKFTPEDDTMLREIVSAIEHSGDSISWDEVATLMGTKTARQCRERYNNYLSPEIKNGAWTPEEEAQLEEKFYEFGPKWAKISQFFPDRSDVNLKNHWSSMLNRKSKQGRTRVPLAPKDESPLVEFDMELIRGTGLFDI